MGVEQAILVAVDYVRNLFHGSDHLLEEVAIQDDDSFDITVSFHPPGATTTARPSTSGRRTLGIDETRQYKLVTVTSDGQVRGVRIRPITVG